MNPESVHVMGTLRADGTLELDERPTLAPGRVRVAIVPTRSPAQGEACRTMLDVLDGIREAQAARGYRGRSIEEMEADDARRRAEDDEYEERWRALWSQTTPGSPRGTDG
jgi:hypothetical protein